MLSYSLGDMKSSDGSSLRYEANAEAGEHARRMADSARRTEAYKKLLEKLPSERLLLYFQFVIKNEIYPYIVQASVIRWHRQNDKTISPKDASVILPDTAIGRALADHWGFDNVSLKFVNPALFIVKDTAFIRKMLKSCAKTAVFKAMDAGYRLKQAAAPFPIKDAMFACHYSEGPDLTKRSDINWYPDSGIKPENVLFYFDVSSLGEYERIPKSVICQMEKEGFRWVSLKRRVMECGDLQYWTCRKKISAEYFIKPSSRAHIERLVTSIGNTLLREVHYWQAFYDEFNVALHYIPDNVFAENIAQAIAFDINTKRQGLLAGKQRSEIFVPSKYNLGF